MKVTLADSVKSKSDRFENFPDSLGGKSRIIFDSVPLAKMDGLQRPVIKLPEVDAQELDSQSFLQGSLDGIQSKFLDIQYVDQIKAQISGIDSKASTISTRLDSLKSFEEIDTVLFDYANSYMEGIEKKLEGKDELSAIEENLDVQKGFTSAVTEGGIGLDTSTLPEINPKQIQQDYFKNFQKLEEAQGSLDRNKRKYSELKNSELKEDGVKRHSLKDTPFFQRFEIGMLGDLTSFKPFDFQTLIGYRIDGRWTLGLGGLCSTGVGKSIDPNWKGNKVYGQYWIKKALFLQSEYQRFFAGHSTPEFSGSPKSRALAGMGTEVPLVLNTKLRSTVLYRINNNGDRVAKSFDSPWQATIGIVYIKK
ncbi:hypothetical protein [Algoriphagus sp. 4150]|uniref:hypothetical protein n=1 Tax=Algoriphagus sp. 4150 TaxID=2817756 RepID=UPI00286B2494|nr:hypothetical protein [Algoriphagus sp. 4150]